MRLLQNLDWDDWALGAWTAVGTGASNAAINGLGLNLIDPKDFNIYTVKFWLAILTFLVIGGMKDFLLFINKNPTPKRIPIKITESAVDADGSKQKRTIETTVAAPEEKKKDV